MSSSLDDLVRFGRVTTEVVKDQPTWSVLATFVAYPFQEGVPAALSEIGDDVDDTLMRLWNKLVTELPQGWPYHIGSPLNDKEVTR